MFHKYFYNLKHFMILSICRLLKYKIESTLAVIQGDKIIIETLIYHNNKLVGEYTFI
jgi:hypothetical protein